MKTQLNIPKKYGPKDINRWKMQAVSNYHTLSIKHTITP